MAGFGDEKLFWCPSLDDAGNGGTTLNDLSGNGYDGTFQNATGSVWLADTSNNGVRCLNLASTSNQYVSNASFPNLNAGSLAIGFWFYQNSLASWASVVGQGSSTAGISQYLISGAIYGFRGNYASGRIWSGAGVYTAATWHLCVITSAKSAAYAVLPGLMYLDGVLVGPISSYVMGTITGNGFSAGRGVPDSSSLNGRIDDIRVWDCTIGEKRIAEWYAGGRGYTPASGGGSAGFTGIRGISKRLGT